MARYQIIPTTLMDQNLADRRDELVATWVDIAIRLGVLAFLLYWSFLLVRPFITIMIWSIVLTVALYPVYNVMVSRLGGRRRLAAALLTLISLLIVIGPATWLVLSLIDGLRTLSDKLDVSALALPPPPIAVKGLPFVGDALYQYWHLASTNLQAAFAKIAPQLKPVGSVLFQITASAGVGAVKFLVAVVVAGFLFSPAPFLVDELKLFSRKSPQGAARNSLSSQEIRSEPYPAALSAFRPYRHFSLRWESTLLEFPPPV